MKQQLKAMAMAAVSAVVGFAQSNEITGKLFDSVGGVPWSQAIVAALSLDQKRVLDWSYTNPGRGPESGGFKLAHLPAMSGKIVLVGFHPSVKSNMWTSKHILDGRPKNLGTVWTSMSISGAMPEDTASLLALSGWISQEVLNRHDQQTNVALADRILKEIGDVRASMPGNRR